MQANVKRGFNRLFVVLSAVWVIYILVIYPLQRREAAHNDLQREFRDCYESDYGKIKDCYEYARAKSGADMWSLRAYYFRESWFLALIVVAVPLLAYGVCRGLLEVGWWVWGGFQS